MTVKVKKLSETATIPTQSRDTDAGWDLYANEQAVIYGGQRLTIDTGIALEIPDGYVGLIWPRSGLAVKHGIDVLAGVIDSSYRGPIKVCLLDTSLDISPLVIDSGDRIAQIIIQEVPKVKMVEVGELSDSTRGEHGFGSSGR